MIKSSDYKQLTSPNFKEPIIETENQKQTTESLVTKTFNLVQERMTDIFTSFTPNQAVLNGKTDQQMLEEFAQSLDLTDDEFLLAQEKTLSITTSLCLLRNDSEEGLNASDKENLIKAITNGADILDTLASMQSYIKSGPINGDSGCENDMLKILQIKSYAVAFPEIKKSIQAMEESVRTLLEEIHQRKNVEIKQEEISIPQNFPHSFTSIATSMSSTASQCKNLLGTYTNSFTSIFSKISVETPSSNQSMINQKKALPEELESVCHDNKSSGLEAQVNSPEQSYSNPVSPSTEPGPRLTLKNLWNHYKPFNNT